MNKEQQELLDEVYKKYQSQTMFRTDDLVSLEELDGMCLGTGEIKKVYRQYAPKEFINICKTDTEFSERWGLKIVSRKLTNPERYKLWFSNNYQTGMEYNESNMPDFSDSYYEPTPTKLITVTYNDKTIESYES